MPRTRHVPDEERKQILVVRLLRLSKRETMRTCGFTLPEALNEADDLLGAHPSGWYATVRYILDGLREDGRVVRVGAKKNGRYVDPELAAKATDQLKGGGYGRAP